MLIHQYLLSQEEIERDLIEEIKGFNYENIKYLFKKNKFNIYINNKETIFTAIKINYFDIVKYFIKISNSQLKLDIFNDIIDKLNNEFLIKASECGRLNIVKYLIEKCNINKELDGLNHALYKTCYYNHLDVVKYLISQGADNNDENRYVLEIASGSGHLDIVKYLRELKSIIQN